MMPVSILRLPGSMGGQAYQRGMMGQGFRRFMGATALLCLTGCASGEGPVAPSAAVAASATPAAGPTAPIIPQASVQAPAPAAPSEDFATWLARFRQEALAAGVSRTTVERALTGIYPLPSVLAADANQPEFTRPVWSYLDSAVSQARINRGRELLGVHAGLFGAMEARWGVPAPIVAAIWAMESNFGSNMGDLSVVQALATLAHSGRRTQYGRDQLMAALGILDRGDVPVERMVGSWAGAMGQTQFIPTTYARHAIDGDGDGRRDLWSSLPDVFGSTAAYLSSSGWRQGLPWGLEVRLPPGFDHALADPSAARPVADWAALGVQPVAGSLPPAGESAAVLLPAGYQGPAFLVTDNFKAILRYNNSTSYALAVGHLADRYRGGAPIAVAWPRHERPLDRAERMELQERLTVRGYSAGAVDGIIGANTRAAFRRWQREAGLPADGFPTVGQLERLRAATPEFQPPAQSQG
jgi:membrane-bound lytic murein transglycosylase B